MSRIFLSYRRQDSQTITGRIKDRLRAHFDEQDLFHDVSSIPPGVDFLEYTKTKLSEAQVFIPVIGKEWAKSLKQRTDDLNDYVRIEVEEALNQDIKIIPILVDGTEMPKSNEVPASIEKICFYNAIHIRPDPDFDHDIKKLEEAIKVRHKLKILGIPFKRIIRYGVLGVLAILLLYIIRLFGTNAPECLEHRVAVLVANFQETGHDGFASSVATEMDNQLENEIFDVRPVGFVSRQVPRYDREIRERYFEKQCDTSGMFVNGFLSKDQEVFNLYTTLVSMELHAPEFIQDNSIILINPPNMEFSIRDDAKFIAEFLTAVVWMYQDETKVKQALDLFCRLSGQNEITLQDSNFITTVSLLIGNCFALRGDEERAITQYKLASEASKPEVKLAALRNQQTAREISMAYQRTPENAQKRQANIGAHSDLDRFLQKFVRLLNKGENEMTKAVESIFNKLKKK
ncbi:MAG: toll/interleukin-1 receptor domain-containing protein [Saprospiraceae bacterium]|nr:toll/interleukin-1 receptor domain-containing protein [Saprospiraceae bacterium]